MSATFKYERAAAVLAEADYSSDKSAAKRYSVTVRSVENWRRKLQTDPKLAELYEARKAAIHEDWAETAIAFLRAGIAKMQALVETATVEHLGDVSQAVKIVGELQVVREALRGDKPQSGGASPRPQTSRRPLRAVT